MARARGNDVTVGGIAGTGNSLLFPRKSRDKHLFVCGATGTGKSKFLEHLIRQDIRSWFKSRSGMLVLDSHGSLYDSVIEWLARAFDMYFHEHGLSADIRDFFTKPIPRSVWEAMRHYHEPDFIRFIETELTALAHSPGKAESYTFADEPSCGRRKPSKREAEDTL